VARGRRNVDRLLSLGPATLLLILFFLAPVIVDVGLAFTNMGRNLRVAGFTTENVQRMVSGDRRLTSVLATTLIYVLCTLAIFNLTYGLLLALVTTECRTGSAPSSGPSGSYRG
jgi:inositol-phosphate transport system permease protein